MVKDRKQSLKPNALTGKVIYRHDLARPKIEDFIIGVVTNIPLIDGNTKQKIYKEMQDVARFVFEESTGEKL